MMIVWWWRNVVVDLSTFLRAWVKWNLMDTLLGLLHKAIDHETMRICVMRLPHTSLSTYEEITYSILVNVVATWTNKQSQCSLHKEKRDYYWIFLTTIGVDDPCINLLHNIHRDNSFHYTLIAFHSQHPPFGGATQTWAQRFIQHWIRRRFIITIEI